MCIFQSGKDIPPLVRISLRTLQYLVIPLLSLAMLVAGSMHLGRCEAQPLLPVWHLVAGSSGLLTPLLYLLFDEINPWLGRRSPGLSECIDNLVVFLLPLYLLFEVGWLVTGTVWVAGASADVEDPLKCDHSIFVFSAVVMVNFWIHVLTPLAFMVVLCCTRIFPFCGYCSCWSVCRTAMDNWTRKTRMIICLCVAGPLGFSMIAAGTQSMNKCRVGSGTDVSVENGSVRAVDGPFLLSSSTLLKQLNMEDMVHIPLWLVTAGGAVLLVPTVYFVYDKYSKDEGGGPLIKTIANSLVILYLLFGLAWALVGFLWVFGANQHLTCGADSFTYRFAFGTLIVLNLIMDIWICFKICVVLYWAFLSDD